MEVKELNGLLVGVVAAMENEPVLLYILGKALFFAFAAGAYDDGPG